MSEGKGNLVGPAQRLSRTPKCKSETEVSAHEGVVFDSPNFEVEQ